jgi:RimJ/RimL family protein N-acetyltransferase
MSHSRALFLVEWFVLQGRLELIEPTAEEVRVNAGALAGYYNEPSNRALLTNTRDFTAGDVVDHFADMRARNDRPFLLRLDGSLVGDCDLRHIEPHAAEYAVMVGPRASQARGLGTRFSLMALVIAFERLGLERVYASVRPENSGSLRMFEKVGYVFDPSPPARRYAEESDDVCVSIAASTFRRIHGDTMARVRVETRPHSEG